MFNTASLRVVNGSKFSQRFVKPRYDSYCFSRLPATIEFLLTGQGHDTMPLDVLGPLPTRYRKVIFFFIDAFGWRFFERYAEKYSFLRTILAKGVVSKLTAQFPSTTAAHVTCVHTGLNVGQSGIYEWSYYEPLVDEIISPLLFSYAGDKVARDSIKQSSIPTEAFFPRKTFYHTLQAQGVKSHIFQHEAYTSSAYSEVVFRGATVHPYRTLSEAFSRLSEALVLPDTAPSYYFLYFDRIDTVCHNYGPYSKVFEETVENSLALMERVFYKAVQGRLKDTLLMITADHGQVEVDARKTFYLNKEVPGIARLLKTNRRGTLLVPAGSARDMFLYVKEEHVDTLIDTLRQRLAGRAEVYRTQELLEQQFFGMQAPSPAFLERVGNVVILPYKDETVWWYEEGRFSMHFQGHHGGLTPEEMEIPLLLLQI
ncbi:MAG TPA: alkaline phosphatase family protein [Ktedonobacteraceae bacterium]|nr:alkaline phosphatase family protein [Ktedonobacteraceae bacterium]